MPPSPCIDPGAAERASLLAIARQAITHGLQRAGPPDITLAGLPAALTASAAVFVTLTQQGKLRGCVGTLEARDPLALAVARAAHNAAFADRRFAAVGADEIDSIKIEISILSPMVPMAVDSRAQLVEQLQPGIDGLMIEDGGHKSTFLPQVWDKISDPETFIEQLLIKAGLAADHWSPGLRAHRYGTLSFHDNA